MKLHSLVPNFSNFYIHGIGSNFIYSHDRSYSESLFSCIAWEKSRLNRSSGKKGQGTAAKQWLVAVPCPSLGSPVVKPRVHVHPTKKRHNTINQRRKGVLNYHYLVLFQRLKAGGEHSSSTGNARITGPLRFISFLNFLSQFFVFLLLGMTGSTPGGYTEMSSILADHWLISLSAK